MKVREILQITGGRLISGSVEAGIDLSKISTDSRNINKGDYFLALNGPNFRGSDFVSIAINRGAVGAISERFDVLNKMPGKVLIKVGSGTKALQQIAAFHRKKFSIPVICVTGSNGKTTVKDMIATVLSARYDVLKNEGTKNNHIGVPQTLLKLKPEHDICVLELGTNHRGEIKALSSIARPTIAVITNIGASHLEFLKDLRGVYEEKRDILRSIYGKKGIAVINGDDEYLAQINCRKAKIIRYGLKKSLAFCADIVSTEKGRITFLLNGKEGFELNLLGVHNVYNALAAIAVARHFKMEYCLIRKTLADYRPTDMRLNLMDAGKIEIIDDSYNSNPLSMKTAVEAMKYYPARARWIVSADMLELGKESVHFHRMMGELIASAGVEGLLTFGELSKHTISAAMDAGMNKNNLWHCATHDEIVDILKQVVRDGDIVLVKGSRGMRMEKVVEKFTAKKG